MKGNSSLAIFSTVFAILLFLSEISGHAASAENGVTSPTIGLLRPFDNDFNLTPIFAQALRKARLGDDPSIDIVLRISINADGMASEVIGHFVWPVLISVGDEHFAERAQLLDSASKERVFEVLSAEFQPHQEMVSKTLAESNWFDHKFPVTYKCLVPLRARIENSIAMTGLVS